MNWIKATRLPICYRNRHLRWLDMDMDDIRSSFSRFKKDIKHRLRKKHAPDREGANPAGGSADLLDSTSRPDHRAAASGHDEEGTGTSTNVLQTGSTDKSPEPEPIRVDKGNNDPQTREEDVDEKEAGQGHPRLDPDIQVAGESGPNQSVHSSQPSASLPRKEEHGGT